MHYVTDKNNVKTCTNNGSCTIIQDTLKIYLSSDNNKQTQRYALIVRSTARPIIIRAVHVNAVYATLVYEKWWRHIDCDMYTNNPFHFTELFPDIKNKKYLVRAWHIVKIYTIIRVPGKKVLKSKL